MPGAVQNAPVEIAMVAGETSGDRLGAGLITELKRHFPHARFYGIGGPKMQSAGFETQFSMERIGVIGLDGLKEKLLDILRIRKTLARDWSDNPPSIFIGVDVPDFNIALESKLRKAGVSCVHYVSPTVWAWRGYRIHKIKRAVDHMLTLFPFESTYYQRHGVPVTCVGHPLADEIAVIDRKAARQALGVDRGRLIALLPGSRRSEVKRLTKPIVEAARLLYQQDSSLQFVVPFASDRVRKVFVNLAGETGDLPLQFLEGRSRTALEASDLAILASGTASLEAALLGVPHVVVYKLSAVSYWIMRRLRQVDHYAMPNHLLPKPMVPELIQGRVSASNIFLAAKDYLDHPDKMEAIRDEFFKILCSLRLDADKRAAEIVVSLIEESRNKVARGSK